MFCALRDAKRRWGLKGCGKPRSGHILSLHGESGSNYRGRNVAEREIGMSEKTFQQKFGAFALVAAVVLLIVNLTVVGPTVFGISTPLLLGITGIIMMRGERSSSGAEDD